MCRTVGEDSSFEDSTVSEEVLSETRSCECQGQRDELEQAFQDDFVAEFAEN